jgi:hypothetical protein
MRACTKILVGYARKAQFSPPLRDRLLRITRLAAMLRAAVAICVRAL